MVYLSEAVERYQKVIIQNCNLMHEQTIVYIITQSRKEQEKIDKPKEEEKGKGKSEKKIERREAGKRKGGLRMRRKEDKM